jgi:uncharacterized damage-inducible protein DinB
MGVLRRTLNVPEGFASREAALFVAQLDDQNRRLLEDLRGATAPELEWQPAPGMNTIGMLLAHLAIVEVYWIDIAIHGPVPSYDATPLLGIGTDDDGIPLPETGLPPATLRAQPLAFYQDLLKRARDHTHREVARLGDTDLAREIRHTPAWDPDTERVFDPRWILYHVLEHLAGHHGQILLLRHHYRVAAGAPAQPA